MKRRWIIIIVIILFVVSSLIWANTRTGMAAKDEKFYSLRILDKLDKVLEKQDLILEELKGLKDKISPKRQ